MEVGAASSSAPDAEATSAAPPDWTSGAGSGVLKVEVQDVLDLFKAHGATLLQAGKELTAMQATVRVRA
jgi:hypothetical protein